MTYDNEGFFYLFAFFFKIFGVVNQIHRKIFAAVEWRMSEDAILLIRDHEILDQDLDHLKWKSDFIGYPLGYCWLYFLLFCWIIRQILSQQIQFCLARNTVRPRVIMNNACD